MSISVKWPWIFLAVIQCLSFIVAGDSDVHQTALRCQALGGGPTLILTGYVGRNSGPIDGRLEWREESGGELKSCRLDVQEDRAIGAYLVRIKLPYCTPSCTPTLRLKSPLHCGQLALDALIAEAPEGGEFRVPIWSYEQCRSSRGVRSVTDKREWAGDDMQWLKRASAVDGWRQAGDLSPYNKKFDAHTMNWLRKRAPEYPWLQKKPTWNAGGVSWLKKRAWNKANAEWLKRGWAHDADMGWLKRGWSSGDVQWLKRAEPYSDLDMPDKRWDHGEIMDWLKKRSVDDVYAAAADKRAWENAHTEWIKRSPYGARPHGARVRRDAGDQLAKRDVDGREKKNWGASGMSWITRDQGERDKKNWGVSGMSWIKRYPGDEKRNWGASGMSWIKRDDDDDDDDVENDDDNDVASYVNDDDDDDDDDVDDNNNNKRNWGASGMSWIKRNPDEQKRNWGASGMSWIKRDNVPDKKNWGSSGMSWIKRAENDNKKRNWGASGMSWIKRDENDDNDDDDEGVSDDGDGIDQSKRIWGASGMSWIKRHEPDFDKKNWGASGMSWIKRAEGEADKRNWGASGMSWIKRADPEVNKKNWGASGMSWIKRDDSARDKKNWGASGMSWIKRDPEDRSKKNWGASGMSWIKRDPEDRSKRNWGASGMSWIKRDPEDRSKKNWGASGMSWIKRDNHEQDKKNWGASGMSWIKRDPEDRSKKNWGASGMSWIKRDAKNSIQDKSNVPHAWKTLKEVIDSKVVPPLHVRSWARESDWLKRSDRYERHALGQNVALPADSREPNGAESEAVDQNDGGGGRDDQLAESPAGASPTSDSHSSSETH